MVRSPISYDKARQNAQNFGEMIGIDPELARELIDYLLLEVAVKNFSVEFQLSSDLNVAKEHDEPLAGSEGDGWGGS